MGSSDWRPVNPRSTHHSGLHRVRPRPDKRDKSDDGSGSEKNFDRSVEEIFTKYQQEKGC